jgi:hypothetical protein
LLNVLISFAQFEREVTGERIRDKIAASKPVTNRRTRADCAAATRAYTEMPTRWRSGVDSNRRCR